MAPYLIFVNIQPLLLKPMIENESDCPLTGRKNEEKKIYLRTLTSELVYPFIIIEKSSY